MLFRFEGAHPVKMWMKDTPLSLDLLFIDADGIVQAVRHMEEPNSERVLSSSFSTSYVLEIVGGASLRHGFQKGSRLLPLP